jgi:PAS domain S-box-containing protein
MSQVWTLPSASSSPPSAPGYPLIRNTEQRFRLFVQNVQEYALFQTDPGGYVTAWNPGAERLFGYATTEMLGEHISVLLAPEDRAAQVLDQEIARVSAFNERVEAARWLVRKDGGRFWARWLSEPILDEKGEPRGIARILRDETQRQSLEDAMRISLAEKEALLKEVHHRVKNNLHVITSMLELQARRTDDFASFRQLEQACNRVMSIARIHELLYQSGSFSGVDLTAYAGRLVPQLVAFYNVQDRIEVAVKGENAIIDLERAVPCGLLLNELVSNSCKHAFPEGLRGRLTVRLAQENEGIWLTVQDTGIGLPASFDLTHSDSLGLTIVRLLTDQLGGSVTIEWTGHLCRAAISSVEIA